MKVLSRRRRGSLEAMAIADRSSSFGENLEEQLGAAAVELQVAQFVDEQQIHAAVAGDQFGEVSVVGGFDEFVDQLAGQGVTDSVAGFGGTGTSPISRWLCRFRSPRSNTGVAGLDPVAACQLTDERGVDRGLASKEKSSNRFGRGEPGVADAALGATVIAVVALGDDQLGQSPGRSAVRVRRWRRSRQKRSRMVGRRSVRQPWSMAAVAAGVVMLWRAVMSFPFRAGRRICPDGASAGSRRAAQHGGQPGRPPQRRDRWPRPRRWGVFGGFAGFQGDDIGIDRTHRQGGGDPRAHIGVIQAAVQQQHLDQGPGSAGIAVGLAGRGPEPVMGSGEDLGRPCLGQRGRPGRAPGLRSRISR